MRYVLLRLSNIGNKAYLVATPYLLKSGRKELKHDRVTYVADLTNFRLVPVYLFDRHIGTFAAVALAKIKPPLRDRLKEVSFNTKGLVSCRVPNDIVSIRKCLSIRLDIVEDPLGGLDGKLLTRVS